MELYRHQIILFAPILFILWNQTNFHMAINSTWYRKLQRADPNEYLRMKFAQAFEALWVYTKAKWDNLHIPWAR